MRREAGVSTHPRDVACGGWRRGSARRGRGAARLDLPDSLEPAESFETDPSPGLPTYQGNHISPTATGNFHKIMIASKYLSRSKD